MTTLIRGRHVHIYPSKLVHESRILRVTDSLLQNGIAEEIVVFGLGAHGQRPLEAVDQRRRLVRLTPSLHRRLPRGRSMALYAEWYRLVASSATTVPIGVIHSNSLFDLPVATWLKLRTGRPLVYDAHEFETERHGMTGVQRLTARLIERLLIRWVDEVIVVSESIADWYRKAYSRRISVVRNKPQRTAARTQQIPSIRARLQIDGGMVFLSHGALQEGRAVPILIDAFSRARPERHLVFVGFGPFVERIREAAQRFTNIHYLEAVPSDEIVALAATADVGLSIIEKTCLSYYYCLPNKLFECEAAGLPVIVSNFPDMGAEVDRWGNGWKVEPTPEMVRNLVNSITPEEIQKRAQASRKAAEEASWDTEEPSLIEAYSRLPIRGVGKPRTPVAP